MRLMLPNRSKMFYTLKEIQQIQTGDISGRGIGCAVVMLIIGGIWAMAGLASLTVGEVLNFFVGLFVLLLAAGVLYFGIHILKNRKKEASIEVRLGVHEVRCINSWEVDDGENLSYYARFENAAGQQIDIHVREEDVAPLKDREGYLVLDEAHSEALMFFPRDLWIRTEEGFAARK